VVYRQINQRAKEDFELLHSSGLYDELVGAGRLIPHERVDLSLAASRDAYAVIKPRQLDFISYPYEWSFGQLQDAATLTLDVQLAALKRGMSLKDASAYNAQLVDGHVALIDTLSFEKYDEGKPWVAYRQFCQHFLAPLALMARTDVRLSQLLRIHIDGVPLDLASKLLPWKTRFSLSLGLHIHAHARTQQRYSDKTVEAKQVTKTRKFSKQAFETIVTSLRSAVGAQKWAPAGTEWADYYDANNNYGREGLDAKAAALKSMLEEVRPATVWDLGANTGYFSRIASGLGAKVIAWDIDPAAVEVNYRKVREEKDYAVIPLLLDLTNPSPAIGWANSERQSFTQRAPVDCAMALGLIHHLVISNNVPLALCAKFFAGIARQLVIEFVPKDDSQVVKLLTGREDIFGDYHVASFEAAFAHYFQIIRATDIAGTKRRLYLMRAKNL
jgi:hypothetical protein